MSVEHYQWPVDFEAEWIPGVNDEYLSTLSTEKLLDLLSLPDESDPAYEQGIVKVEYYIRYLLYREECLRYREGELLEREDKWLFMAGLREVTQDLRYILNFKLRKVRTKETSRYKGTEAEELRGCLGYFVDGLTTRESAYSEIADIFYNLFHLKSTDPESIAISQFWIEKLAKTLQLTEYQVALLVAAKYHTRMFEHTGKNSPDQENVAVKLFLDTLYPENYDDEFFKDRCSDFLSACTVLFNHSAPNRMSAIGGEMYGVVINRVHQQILHDHFPELLSKED